MNVLTHTRRLKSPRKALNKDFEELVEIEEWQNCHSSFNEIVTYLLVSRLSIIEGMIKSLLFVVTLATGKY